MKKSDEDQCYVSPAVSWLNVWLLLCAFLIRLLLNANHWYQSRVPLWSQVEWQWNSPHKYTASDNE
ncbi:hypothetical protein E2C01_075943 [Portunus trituberculatus]|uniref:Uncharacterized protein n=1 Tax=Portunus trituberculatus TaxID=210409 RepID=A0A5B7IG84_PORTR|nr:hypothetical protein [Portunus trituberculatus]